MTNSQCSREIAVVISSTMPSAKYSCSGSPLILAKGNTAIDGLSGSGSAGGSAAPTRAPRVKPAGFGSLGALPSPACAGLSGENLSEGFPAKFGSNDADFTLAPRRPGGEGRVRGADVPVRGAAHLTLPLRGPLPLPPEGRRGVLASDRGGFGRGLFGPTRWTRTGREM